MMVLFNVLFPILFSMELQAGNRITIDDVRAESTFDQNKTDFKAFGSFSVEPFDIKDKDAYVLYFSNLNEELVFHKFEKFQMRSVSALKFNWSYTFTVDKPKDDFNFYAILVDKFSDRYYLELSDSMGEMSSIESVVTYLRRKDRIDPMNFAIFWVRVD